MGSCSFDGNPWAFEIEWVEGARSLYCSRECVLKWAKQVQADQTKSSHGGYKPNPANLKAKRRRCVFDGKLWLYRVRRGLDIGTFLCSVDCLILWFEGKRPSRTGRRGAAKKGE